MATGVEVDRKAAAVSCRCQLRGIQLAAVRIAVAVDRAEVAGQRERNRIVGSEQPQRFRVGFPLAHLVRIGPRLRELEQMKTHLRDTVEQYEAGNEELKASKTLTRVHLAGSKVGNASLEDLRTAPALKYLRLDRTAVDGDGLKSLKSLTGLKTLT